MSDQQPSSAPQFTTGKADRPTRPWFKKKRFVIPIALVVLLAVAGAAGGGSKNDSTAGSKSVGQGVGDGFKGATKKNDGTAPRSKDDHHGSGQAVPGPC